MRLRTDDVATGMRATFAVAAMFIVIALVFAVTSHTRAMRAVDVRRFGGHPAPGDVDSRKGAHDNASASPVGVRPEVVELAHTSRNGIP